MRFARALSVLVLFVQGSAFGAGFYVPDLGARALGRAGAFTARADDATAAWYNPAGLADQGGTRVLLDLGFIKQSVNYQRTDENGNPGGFSPIGSTAFPFTIPFLGISSDFGLKNWTFSLSAYGPYASKYQYPEQGSQRYVLVQSGVLEAIYQLSVAWRPLPWLRFGASLQNEDVAAQQKLTLSVFPGAEGSTDVRVNFDVSDHFTPNFHLGMLISPTPFLDFGVSFKRAMPVDAEGTLDINADDLQRLRTERGLTGLSVTGNQIGLQFELPQVLRAGLRFKHPRFDVEADFVWERWTGFSTLKVIPKDIRYTLTGGDPQPLTPIIQNRGYGDAYSVRVGSDIEIIPGRLTGRLGYFYETSAVPEQSLNVSAVDTEKHGFTVGLTARYKWFAVTAAYAYVALAEKMLLNSNTRQINLADIALGQPDAAPIVANGRYRSGYDMLAIGFQIDIDTVVGWTRRQ